MKTITDTTKYSLPESVVMLGKFDGVHLGHAKLIKTGVDISRDKNLSSVIYTFTSPECGCITSDEKRRNIFEKMQIEYAVFENFTEEFKSISPEDFVKNILAAKLNAKHIVVGFNYRFGCGRAGDTELLKTLCGKEGISLSVIEPVEMDGALVSSTLIRQLIADGDVKKASEYLGRCYEISGTTASGKSLGRTIGFATANLADTGKLLLPGYGVYVTRTFACGKSYISMTNVGINPTVENISVPKAETHLIGYAGELYGEKITIEFVDKIRDEKKFNSVEELKNQLECDREYVKSYFGG